MDNTKIYAILKKSLHIKIACDSDGGQWIGDDAALYNVDGLPKINSDNILPLIGVDIDNKAKYAVHEIELPYSDEILSGSAEGDGLVSLTDINIGSATVMRGIGQNAPPCVFINASYLRPFVNDDEISYIIKPVNNDAGYVILAVRGLIILAVIMPMYYREESSFTNEMINDLQNAINTIKQQIADSNEQLSLDD